MMGNEAKVDDLGFVEAKMIDDNALSHVFTRIPGNCSMFIIFSFASVPKHQ